LQILSRLNFYYVVLVAIGLVGLCCKPTPYVFIIIIIIICLLENDIRKQQVQWGHYRAGQQG